MGQGRFEDRGIESGNHATRQGTGHLIRPQRHATQGALKVRFGLQVFVVAAVFHQQRCTAIIIRLTRSAADLGDLLIQAGFLLPAEEPRRTGDGAQPGGKARLQGLHTVFGGVQHDVERFDEKSPYWRVFVGHQRLPSSGFSRNTNPLS